MPGSSRMIVALVAVAGLMAAFWVLALSPKREEASDLAVTVTQLETTLAQHQQEVTEALAAREGFSDDYRQLVVLGKAVPGEDDTASLLVELKRIADDAKVRFRDFELTDAGSGEAPAAEPAAAGTESAAPTEVAASLLPLGATIGPASLGVMPYSLTFTGDFSHVADFIAGLDKLVKTKNEELSVTGRLITVDGFSLTSSQGHPFPQLEATFTVTTFLTPPGQGLTAGAAPIAPVTTATPASLTTEGTP